MEGQPPTKNGGSNDCRKFWTSLMCGSQDLTLQAILSNGVATVRQTLRRMFSAMAAERAKKRRKLVLTPVNNNHRAPALRVMQRKAAQTSGRLECSYQDWAILFQVF